MARIFSVTSVQLTILKSNPIQILVVAQGMAATSGWKNIDLVPVDGSEGDGILDLEFVGTPPTGISLPVLTPVTGDFVIGENADKLSGVLVHARSNQMPALIGGATNPGGPSTGVDRFAPFAGAGQVTTFAIGEEGPITTAAIGETLAFRPAETFPLTPAESFPFDPVEKLPIFETNPIRDFGIPTKPGIGEGGPLPDPPPDFRQFLRTPFGG